MDVVSIARELGTALQATPEYAAYKAAKEENDKDEDLQKLIGEFNLQRMSINNEIQKPEGRDEKKIEEINNNMQETYAKIMSNPHMEAFAKVKDGIDGILNEVNAIITMSANGEDPMTCQMPHDDCGGSCESCAGCH